jgi:hypothetical protein
LNAPGYFAYDDVAVRFDKNDQTAISNLLVPSSNGQKMLMNGQIVILREGKTYTIMGQELK